MSYVEEVSPTPFNPRSGGNIALGITIVVLMTISLYNSIELLLLILLNFQHYNSLYFWSLITSCSLGVIPATLGPALQILNLLPLWLSLFLSDLGFLMMVPNQSVVLYSRLHLVSSIPFALRFVRWLITTSILAIAAPTVVLNIGSTLLPHSSGWSHGFEVAERIQVSWFAVQETVISGMYIYETIRILKLRPERNKRRDKILYELLAINIMAITMDLALVILEYMGLYFTQIILKSTVYSIKLKLEFAVLGMLVSIVRPGCSWQTDYNTITVSPG